MENRIKEVMSNILCVDIENINEETSSHEVESWDSLKQMNLVIALEEEFNIIFDDDEILELQSYPLILIIIKEKLN